MHTLETVAVYGTVRYQVNIFTLLSSFKITKLTSGHIDHLPDAIAVINHQAQAHCFVDRGAQPIFQCGSIDSQIEKFDPYARTSSLQVKA